MRKNAKKKPDPTPEIKAEPLKPRPVHTWTLEQWKASPIVQAQLREILESDIVRMAFQTLLVMVMPNAKPARELVPGVSAEQMMLIDNNRYHHRSGMSAMYRLLHGLAKDKDRPELDKTKAPWGQLIPENE